MTAWFYFWTFDFIVAGSAFAIILVLVAVRGFADLMSMFHQLDQERDSK